MKTRQTGSCQGGGLGGWEAIDRSFEAGAGAPKRRPRARPAVWAGLLLSALVSWPAAANPSLNTLATFYGTNGAVPYAGLVIVTNGTNFTLYGTTSGGGEGKLGTVFSVTPFGGLTNLVSFNGPNGANPMGGLILGLNGYLYGTTAGGGDASNGTVFAVSPTGQFYPQGSFGGTNGSRPECALLEEYSYQDGGVTNLYGTTYAGGASNFGGVFYLTETNLPPPGTTPKTPVPNIQPQINLVASFDYTNTGGNPIAGLTDYGNVLYGVTTAGGSAYRAGTFFQVSNNVSTGTASIVPLLWFAYTNGLGPQGSLFLSTNLYTNPESVVYPYLFGTTPLGGTNSNSAYPGGGGTIFAIAVAFGLDGFEVTNFESFSLGLTNGAMSFSGLIEGGDGNLYGTTYGGGAHNSGTVFSFSPSSNTFNLLYSFPGGSGGANPYGGVVQGPDGNLYGTTLSGGRGQQGTVFQITGFPPYLLTPLTNQVIQTSNTAAITALAGGSAPLTYEWFYNSNQLSNGKTFSGTTTSTLVLSNAQPHNSGLYEVIVRNRYGAAASSNITLTVVTPYGQTPPKVNITGPAHSNDLGSAEIKVTGNTVSTVAVAQVYFNLKDSGWQLATPVNGWKQWSAEVELSPGTNTFRAYAVNIVGVSSLTNTAYFVPSPFVPIAGAYNGLFYDTNSVTPTNAGFFTAQASYLGSFSGSLQMGNAKYSFSGPLGTNGTGQASVSAGSLGTLEVSLQFDLTGGSGHLIGSVSNAAWPGAASLAGDLAVYNAKTNPAPQQGLYTLVIPGTNATAPQPVGNDSGTARVDAQPSGSSSPPLVSVGDGWATVTVDSGGSAHLSGATADSASLKQVVPIARGGAWPLYVSLYSGKGLLLGWLSFAGDTKDALSGDVVWLKPALSSTKFYTNAVTLETAVAALPYTVPARLTNLFNATNLVLTLNGGVPAQNSTNHFDIDASNRIHDVSPGTLSLSFTTSSGSFKGTLTPAAAGSKPFSLYGVVLEGQGGNPGAALGFFTGPGQSGSVSIVPGTAP